jgi:hypothetical protein
MYTSISAGILALAAAAQCFGQPIKVAEGGNRTDASTWVTMTMASQTSYQMGNGAGKFAPVLTVRCDSKGKPGKEDRTIAVLLDTGGVQPGTLTLQGSSSVTLTAPKENPVRLARENLLLRMKFDAGRPQRRAWELLAKSDSVYQYMGNGETPVGSILTPGELIKKLFSTTILTIEFPPFGQSTFGTENLFTAEFHPAGLKQDFQEHKECSLK